MNIFWINFFEMFYSETHAERNTPESSPAGRLNLFFFQKLKEEQSERGRASNKFENAINRTAKTTEIIPRTIWPHQIKERSGPALSAMVFTVDDDCYGYQLFRPRNAISVTFPFPRSQSKGKAMKNGGTVQNVFTTMNEKKITNLGTWLETINQMECGPWFHLQMRKRGE